MGMLDDIIGGIEAAAGTPPAGETPPKAEAAPAGTSPAGDGEKPLHSYSDAFKAKYGERKKPA